MRVIIAGGRDFDDFELLSSEVEFFETHHSSSYLTVICGGARGADNLGEKWAKASERSVVYHIPEWDKYGKSAGYRRNVEMANDADALIAFWDGESKGTKHMIDIALDKGLLVQVVKYCGA